MTKSFIGYQENLPIQKGSVILIPKGTVIRMSGGRTQVAQRNRKVTVFSVFQGITIAPRENAPGYTSNPTVRWVASQEEFEADINDIRV